jgi:hypothetical protein
LAMVYKPRLLKNESSVFHDNEIRDAHDIEPLSEGRRTFCIDFQNDRPARHFGRSTLNFRGRHATRPAPGCPEINQHRNAGTGNDLIKGRGVRLDRLSDRRQRSFARTTSSYVSEMFGGSSVLYAACRAILNHIATLQNSGKWRKVRIGY